MSSEKNYLFIPNGLETLLCKIKYLTIFFWLGFDRKLNVTYCIPIIEKKVIIKKQ